MTVASEITDLRQLHFIGIGGAGTAPLAGIMLQRGYKISGSDLCLNAKTAQLSREGAAIYCGHAAEHLPSGTDLVIYSSAIVPDNPELVRARQLDIPCRRRGEFLARLAASYSRPVTVSGSHGKTTVAAMLSWMLRHCGVSCGYLVGGKVNAFPDHNAGDGDIFVTEVDESDGTNALFSSVLGVVVNVEDDHSWSVGGSRALLANFARFGRQAQTLIYVRNATVAELFAGHPDALELDETALAEMPGLDFRGFMKINAALAVCAAEKLGIPAAAAKSAVNAFPGVARRMTVHFESPDSTLIEDYAHHPTEVARSLELLRLNYPHHHLRVIFQPHRYARLAKYIDAFARELNRADSVFVVPVFAAWTETGKTDSRALAERIGPQAEYLDSDWAEMPAAILSAKTEKLLLAVLGAGDVDQLIPELVKQLQRRERTK
ncbi:MAG: Mur ligase domain-containing protein [Victivallaceae bacterium]|nr:Mur ligase domain-containing protein [Victivallaceae bacterium]